MRLAFLADVHSNLEAFSSVKKSLRCEGVDKVIFTGDIVGYAANPNECIEMLKEISDEFIAGNHDWAAAGKTDTSNYNPSAKEAIEWTRNELSEQNRSFLSSLPLNKEIKHCICTHASVTNPEKWNYIVTVSDAADNFKAFSHDLCFIGHTHCPAVFVRANTGKTFSLEPQNTKIKAGFRYIINTGSIGQPRDGIPLASYGIYDMRKNEYRLIRVQYDVARAQKKIIAAGLPEYSATRLEHGK